MRIGFTGSRAGLTLNQRSQFWSWYAAQPATEFHQGCCIGSDSEATRVVYITSRPIYIIGHPGNLPAYTCEATKELCNEVRGPLPNLVRNRVIVDSCDVLAACPSGPEELRSGTWACVRYARRAGRRIVYFWSDGIVTEETP